MNRLIAIITVLLVSLSMTAMDERLERINSIKKNPQYLYGEITMQTQEEATSMAYELLQKEVFAWAKHDDIKLAVNLPAEINKLADSIMMRRANMYRVFVYVDKQALTTCTKDTVAIQKTDTNTVPKDSIVNHRDSLVSAENMKMIKQHFFGNRKKSDALMRLKEAKDFFELKEIMQPLKEKGEIIDYGKYATAKNPELCYLIIYDPAGNIKALLGKGKDKRQNLKTGQEDSISNYRGCGAIWFLLNEK